MPGFNMAEISKNNENLDVDLEILKPGTVCPNCGFLRLVFEGSFVFCGLCGYGQKRCG